MGQNSRSQTTPCNNETGAYRVAQILGPAFQKRRFFNPKEANAAVRFERPRPHRNIPTCCEEERVIVCSTIIRHSERQVHRHQRGAGCCSLLPHRVNLAS